MTEGRKFAKKDDDVMPSIYEHCCNTYRKMLEQSKSIVTVDGVVFLGLPPEEEGSIIVYEGYLTALITQELRLSVPYYSFIRKHLRDMGCIRQLKRGGGTSPSQWEMITEPTPQLFKDSTPKRPTTPNWRDLNEHKIIELQAIVSQHTTDIQSINEFLAAQFGTEGEV